jgi:GR25 family glycosyltransferase involved in LPS biosynthesis
MAVIDLDAIRIISLEERTDRREQSTSEFQKAVDAGIFPDIKPEFVNRLKPAGSLWPASFSGHRGYYQATCEHIRILEELFQNKKDLALILEDDFVFTKSFFDHFETFWQEIQTDAPDWLALFLGGTDQNGRSPIKGTTQVALNKGSTRSHAYIVNRAGMWRLYDHLFCDRRVVDWSYVNMMSSDACCYSPSKEWYVETRESWSNNRQCIAKYGS